MEIERTTIDADRFTVPLVNLKPTFNALSQKMRGMVGI